VPVVRGLRLTAVIVMLIATLSGRAPAQSPSPPAFREPPNMAALVAAAAKEGGLDVAWGATYGGADGAREIQEHINRIYHINLQIRYSPVANGAAFQTQVAQEVRAGHVASSDILFHVRDANLAEVAQPVDFRKYVPQLPENNMYFGKRAVVALTVLESFIYNTKMIPPNQVPKSFADLLDPKWKGKIASTNYQGLFGNYLGVDAMMGHAGMLAYYRKFSQQVAGLMTCGDTDRVASGEFLIFGLDCGDHQTRLAQRKGQPLGIIHPSEGTAIYAFAPGIPLTAAHPAAARLFIAYLLTRDGQKVLWDVMGGDNAALPGSHMAGIIAQERRRGVRFINTFGLGVKHPELFSYASEINAIMNAGK
jgi:ABC-type Fe3+ transport system substrate-binding protein